MEDKRFFYDRIANEFDSIMDMYDTTKRLRIVFDEILTERFDGKKVLDAGCGTGWFSQKASVKGGSVVSLDIGFNLLKKVKEKCNTIRITGDLLCIPFKDEAFEIVVSSEAIEHTEDPSKAFIELTRVLKPGGILVLTVPNKVWHWAVRTAQGLRLRSYHGYENWCGWEELKKWCSENDLLIKRMYGFHLFPFNISWTHRVLNFSDRFGKSLGPIMLNIALMAEKRISG